MGPWDEVVLKRGGKVSPGGGWAEDDRPAESSEVGEHRVGERSPRAEQTVAQRSKDSAMSAPSFLFIIHDEFPFVGIKTDAGTFIADAEGIFSRTGAQFHEHLAPVFL